MLSPSNDNQGNYLLTFPKSILANALNKYVLIGIENSEKWVRINVC